MSTEGFNPNFPTNLRNCADEPIQIPGAVQPFGFLIAYDRQKRVRAVSANAVKYFPALSELEHKSVSLDGILTFEAVGELAPADLFAPRALTEQLVKVRLQGRSDSLFGVIFSSADLTVLELETESQQSPPDSLEYLADLPRVMKEIHARRDLSSLANSAVDRMRSLTGFDRVMFYRFDEDWNGEVIAEAKETELGSFLGQHFPASDIPVQARKLYEKKWIRIIPTIDYVPSPISPKSRQSLDLSESMLRSVSPIHLQYLRNMGIKASMSISLIVEGKLWGLIACHHYAPYLVGLKTRLGCEAYGQLVSSHIATLLAAENASVVQRNEMLLHNIMSTFAEERDFRTAARAKAAELLELFLCDGIMICLGRERVQLGTCPDEDVVAAISDRIKTLSVLNPFVTTRLSAQIPTDAVRTSLLAGVLGLSLSKREDYFILCFRRSVDQAIDWAGRPEQASEINFSDPAQRLQPRGSFALWRETHRGASLRWEETLPESLKRFGLLFVKIVVERQDLVEKSNLELMDLSRAKDEFVAMVSHELRTPLNSIIGWTELALSGELKEDKVAEALRVIQRNARSQHQLVNDLLDVSRILAGKLKLSVKNMRVTEVAEAAIIAFAPTTQNKNIQIIPMLGEEADSIIGDPQRIQQIIWNLVSNAVKFSPKGSKIWVRAKRIESQIEVEVRDQGIGIEPSELGRIFGRFQQVDSSIGRRAGGLGLGLSISQHIAELHGGTITAESEGKGKGACFRLRLPIGPVASETSVEGASFPDEYEENKHEVVLSSTRLKQQVVLIVEDEPDAARFLELLLKAHGARTFVANDGQEALQVLKTHGAEISVVLSDVGMPILDGYQLAREIRASSDPKIQHLCLIALTAYGRSLDRIAALRAGFNSYIAKPVMQEELLVVLESACKDSKRPVI